MRMKTEVFRGRLTQPDENLSHVKAERLRSNSNVHIWPRGSLTTAVDITTAFQGGTEETP